ncbi:MAG: tRNA (5-methylaminomethyl-2-thiouridine)(34)-methyltransferase MnmD [Agriterribacter sp.]
MHRVTLLTGDGSPTIMDTRIQQTYHSMHGAVTESQHVYIAEGFNAITGSPEHLNILEVGFGTGLNALLTLCEAMQKRKHVVYTAVEPFPLTEAERLQLNYCTLLQKSDLQPLFEEMHTCQWGRYAKIHSWFTLYKINLPAQELPAIGPQHLIYFDAFAPAAQPELWTKEVFSAMYGLLLAGGMLVTYSGKGEIRRNMAAAGFAVSKRPGAPGKREMTVARKPL